MWLPCNFEERIRLRQHQSYELEEAELIGLQSAPVFNKTMKPYCFVFKLNNGQLHHMDPIDTIAYWPQAFNNQGAYDQSTLHEGEIDLLINIDNAYYQFNKYFFDTKSRASGRLISLIKHDDGWHYHFFGHDSLGKTFIVPEIFTEKPFMAYEDDPLLS